MSLAKLGKGTIVRRGGTTSPAAYTAIPEILSISGMPAGIPDLVDVTNHDSPGLYREQITGLIQLNEITITANYIADVTQDAIRDDLEAGTERYYEIEIPAVGGNQICRFPARARSWDIDPQIAAQQILKFSLAPTSAPVWT